MIYQLAIEDFTSGNSADSDADSCLHHLSLKHCSEVGDILVKGSGPRGYVKVCPVDTPQGNKHEPTFNSHVSCSIHLNGLLGTSSCLPGRLDKVHVGISGRSAVPTTAAPLCAHWKDCAGELLFNGIGCDPTIDTYRW